MIAAEQSWVGNGQRCSHTQCIYLVTALEWQSHRLGLDEVNLHHLILSGTGEILQDLQALPFYHAACKTIVSETATCNLTKNVDAQRLQVL